MNIKKTEQFVCPHCGAEGKICNYDMDIDGLWMGMYCLECDERWSEWAQLTYDGCSIKGQAYDKEGKEIND